MAATNIFYRIPSQRGTRVATLAGTDCTLDQFCNYIINSEGLNLDNFIIANGTKVFRPTSCNLNSISLQNNSHVDILIPLLGGKGGFGSLLRAIGAQIEKTTNRDACRDLSGRRLRDVKREDELKKLLALQEKLQEEQKRRRQEKLDKLKKSSERSTTSASIQELIAMFDDDAYNKRRLELGDILEAAVEKGIINYKKRMQQEIEPNDIDGSKRLRLESKSSEAMRTSNNSEVELTDKQDKNIQESHESLKVQPNSAKKSSRIKRDIWLGLDSDEAETDNEI